MVVVNTDYITGQQLQTLSIVRGSVVMTKHIGSDIGASFKTLVGGEIKAYTDMLNNAREIATARMMEDAARFGADAVINVRFTTSSVMQGDTCCRYRRQIHKMNVSEDGLCPKKKRVKITAQCLTESGRL